MKRKLHYFLFFVLLSTTLKAQFTTPNTGVTWTLSDLATNAPATISLSGGIYTLSQNLTIAPNDHLSITSDAVININADVQIIVQGSLISDANAITITATDPTTPYNSIIFEAGSTGFMRNTTINYGKGIRLSTGNFEMQSCTMSYHVPGTTTSSAINFSTGSPVINNSTFTFNNYPAFSSGANQETSPTLSNNYLFKNNQSNTNRPQINMGPSGADTLRIVGNTIIGDVTKPMTGGIGASSLLGGANKVIIDGNIVRDNRYGITVVGASSSGFIRNNIIEDNDTQNLPNSGGSGISLSASGATTMNIIASNNQIRRNLWGITVIGTARINLGDGADNPGGNIFADNGNGGQTYALFNNTALPIMAMNNCWIEGTTLTATTVENVISHQVDNASLGLVTFTPFGCDALSTPDFAIAKPKIYPNPSSGIFTISTTDGGMASLFSIKGVLIGKYDLTQGENLLQLQLASGVYILKTENSEGSFNQKLVIR